MDRVLADLPTSLWEAGLQAAETHFEGTELHQCLCVWGVYVCDLLQQLRVSAAEGQSIKHK